MPTPTYREVVRPSLIDTNIPSSGTADAAQSLAQSFKQFERTGAEVLGNLRAEQGRREGAEAGRTNDPAFRTGMASLTAYGRAYNDSATRSYAIQSEAAADEAATRLELEAGNDPEVFKATFGARRDAVLKEAPPEAREILAEVYDRRMAASVSRLIGAQGMEILKQQRSDVAEGVARSTDRIGQLLSSDDPAQHALADEELIKQNMLIDAAVNDRTISATEGSVLKVDASRRVTEQTVSYRFRAEMENPYGDPVAFIERLKEANKTSEALPPEEEQKLVTSLLNELQEKNALTAAGLRATDTAQKVRWELGNRQASLQLVTGTLTANKISKLLEDDAIDPNRATALYNDLQAGNDRPDDEREHTYVNATLLEYTEQEILENQKLSWKTRRELVEKRRQQADGWRGTQQAREGSDRIDRALGIVPGAIENGTLSREERTQRERALTSWYDTVDALPPAERQAKAIETAENIADDVIRGNTAKKIANLKRQLQNNIRDAGPVEAMGEEEKAKFDQNVADKEKRIRELEQRLK